MTHSPQNDYRIIQQWIKNGEGHKIDFKTTITSYPKIAKSICAFANSRGGRIVVGVEDKGQVVGVDIEEEKYALEKAATEFCSPAIPLSFQILHYGPKFILVAEVRESQNKPHYAQSDKGSPQLLVRIADQCVAAPGFIRDMIISGDLNNLMRSGIYKKNMADDLQLFMGAKSLSVSAFAEMKKITEKDARRRLVDYMLDGQLVLVNETDGVFSAADHLLK